MLHTRKQSFKLCSGWYEDKHDGCWVSLTGRQTDSTNPSFTRLFISFVLTLMVTSHRAAFTLTQTQHSVSMEPAIHANCHLDTVNLDWILKTLVRRLEQEPSRLGQTVSKIRIYQAVSKAGELPDSLGRSAAARSYRRCTSSCPSWNRCEAKQVRGEERNTAHCGWHTHYWPYWWQRYGAGPLRKLKDGGQHGERSWAALFYISVKDWY